MQHTRNALRDRVGLSLSDRLSRKNRLLDGPAGAVLGLIRKFIAVNGRFQAQWLCPPRPMMPIASTAAIPNASQNTCARV